MTPTAARRTSRRSPSASTAHASLDAPPASSTGSVTSTSRPRTRDSACWKASRTSAIIAPAVTSVIPEPIRARREQVRAFMEEHVYPNEGRLFTEDEHADTLVAEL